MHKKRLLKEILQNRCLPELKERCAYFDVGSLRAWLKKERIPFNCATVNRYMTDFVKDGFVWSAGRGWYSFVPSAIQLDAEPLTEIKRELQARFPLLDFACWSTQQINSAQCMSLYGISRQAINADFSKLLRFAVIQRVGAGRSTHYVLSNDG